MHQRPKLSELQVNLFSPNGSGVYFGLSFVDVGRQAETKQKQTFRAVDEPGQECLALSQGHLRGLSAPEQLAGVKSKEQVLDISVPSLSVQLSKISTAAPSVFTIYM